MTLAAAPGRQERSGPLAGASVTVYESFEELSAGGRALLAAGVEESLYHSLEWYENLTRHGINPADRPRLYALEGSDRAFALLPLLVTSRPGGPGYGRGLTSLSNYYSSLYGPILGLGPEQTPESLRRITAAIRSDAGGPWDFINLSPLPVESPIFGHLTDALRASGMVVQPYFCFGNWYLEVGGRSSGQYFQGLPSQLKATIKRKTKKLEGADARISILAGPTDLAKAIGDYEAVYRESWKESEPYPDFVPNLIRTCAHAGWLRLGLLHVAGRPVAAQIWIVTGKTASIYKLAYDEKYAALSPGTVLTTRLMEHVIDHDKVSVVDYLTGDDAYKKDWMSHRRERWGLLALNPRTVRGAMGIGRHLGGRLVKNLQARLRTLLPIKAGAGEPSREEALHEAVPRSPARSERLPER